MENFDANMETVMSILESFQDDIRTIVNERYNRGSGYGNPITQDYNRMSDGITDAIDTLKELRVLQSLEKKIAVKREIESAIKSGRSESDKTMFDSMQASGKITIAAIGF